MSSRQGGGKKKSRGSWVRTVLELSLFGIWLAITGLAGYFIGSSPSTECIPLATNKPVAKSQMASSQECIEPTDEEDSNGLSYEQIKQTWACKFSGNTSQFNRPLLPSDGQLSDTRWNTILTVDPNRFFEMYLTQYPGDTRAVQPVVIFSHQPLKSIEELPKVCTVLDIAIVPDSPGVCVAVTETFHDVASYHMLHADRQVDGTFSLTSNYLEAKHLPSDEQYAQAREMLKAYFRQAEYVTGNIVSSIRSVGKKVVVGCIVENLEDFQLFENSLKFADKAGMSRKIMFLYSTSADVITKARALGINIVNLVKLSEVGASIGPVMRRHFLQAWLAFAVADKGVRMVWQSPATIWLKHVKTVIEKEPNVEVLWAFKGRKDRRAAPFFVSFDFFTPSGSERPVHLMHELMLHFDLILAWQSMDAVASYRLAENNARYGTTTHIFAPTSVLHVDYLGRKAVRIKEAMDSDHRPDVLVFPHEDAVAMELVNLLQQTNLWLL